MVQLIFQGHFRSEKHKIRELKAETMEIVESGNLNDVRKLRKLRKKGCVFREDNIYLEL